MLLPRHFLRLTKTVALFAMAAVVSMGCRGCSNNPLFGGSGSGSASALGAPNGIESSALPEPIRGETPRESPDMKRVFFEFDSADLIDRAKVDVDANIAYLKRNPSIHVQIEGHCDSRGTGDYNFALGQRRADACRTYMIANGIAANRLHTISYGAERPLQDGSDEISFARNRRADFLIYGK